MEFSKKMLVLHVLISICLCIMTVVAAFEGADAATIGILAGSSFVTDGAWGGFYYWKAKNENRWKYAQKFVKLLADSHGVDAAIRMAEVVLKD